MGNKRIRPSEAAVRTGVHPNTIRNWIWKRKLRAYRTLGGHWRISEADLERSVELHGSDDNNDTSIDAVPEWNQA